VDLLERIVAERELATRVLRRTSSNVDGILLPHRAIVNSAVLIAIRVV
jgi:hypothetical protein